eukprot:5904490-Prymnesium_polylepis.1
MSRAPAARRTSTRSSSSLCCPRWWRTTSARATDEPPGPIVLAIDSPEVGVRLDERTGGCVEGASARACIGVSTEGPRVLHLWVRTLGANGGAVQLTVQCCWRAGW